MKLSEFLKQTALHEDDGGGDAGGGDMGAGGQFVGGDGATSQVDTGSTTSNPPPDPAPTNPPTPPHQCPPGGGYVPTHSGYGFGGPAWGLGPASGLWWILSGQKALARMQQIGVSKSDRKRLSDSTKNAAKGLWITGHNSVHHKRKKHKK